MAANTPKPSRNWLASSLLLRGGRSLSGGVLQLLYPKLCWTCGRSLSDDATAFCPPCEDELKRDPHEACPRCAATVGPYADIQSGCPNCAGESFGFQAAIRMGQYEGLRQEVIVRLKDSANEGLAEQVGKLWARCLASELRQVGADAIVPVPLYWWRRLRRGYNQSEVLAQVLASRIRVPCRTLWLRRVRSTPKQTRLPRTTRLENLRGAFRASRSAQLKDKTILLVDDVMTTGTTASEAAKVLRRAGAKRVVVAVIARAV